MRPEDLQAELARLDRERAKIQQLMEEQRAYSTKMFRREIYLPLATILAGSAAVAGIILAVAHLMR